MQIDPATEFRRLAEEYRAKTDDELRELAEDLADLTEPAQQALRQEMQNRRLGDPSVASQASQPATTASPVLNEQSQRPQNAPDALAQPIFPADTVSGYFGHPPKIVPDDESNGSEDDANGPADYTWKTVLCECESTDEARHLVDALRSAGLDGWVDPSREFGRSYARVLVAADQLDQARSIAERPIPQQIIDDSNEEIPEFVEPKCPKCGSDDVVLESVDSENHWRCEQCDAEWSDPAEVEDAKGEKAAGLPS